MKRSNRSLPGIARLLLWAVAGLFWATCALAQSPDADPPDRVARLADLSGQVWVYSPDDGDWIAAVRNQPLTSGDRLATDAGARAELQVGSTTLRLDGGSEVEIVTLDDQRAALQLLSGSLAARIRTGEAAREFSLSTADGRFRVEQPGRYRFDRLDRASAATVYVGQALYEGERSALAVTPGQRAEFWIDAANVAQYSLASPARDAFVAWIDERDGRDVVASTASRYVSPEMPGVDELDRYGAWDQDPDYGAVWTPRSVAAGWTPYSAGRWSFVRPWGWTWIDDAPWGFAPFHYGRWVNRRNNWCWVPGSRGARPVYAPALVAWVGGGNNFNRSFGGRSAPAVGWFPLAPRDVYVPGYRYSPRYVRDINIGHVRDGNRIDEFINMPPDRRDFGNRRFPHALTMVPADVVRERRPVGPAAAEWRNDPRWREGADEPRRNVAVTAPPLAAPAMPARTVDPRTVRPPGFARTDPGNDPRNDPRFGGRPPPGVRGLADEANAARPPGTRDARDGGAGRSADDPRLRTPGGRLAEDAASPREPRESRERRATCRPLRRAPTTVHGRPTVPAAPGPNARRRASKTGARREDAAAPSRSAPVEQRRDPAARNGDRNAPPPGVRDERRTPPGLAGEARTLPAAPAEERRPLPGTSNDRRALPGPGNDSRPPPQPSERQALPGTSNEVRPGRGGGVPDERRAPSNERRPVEAVQNAPPAPRPQTRAEPTPPARQAEAPRPPPAAVRVERAERPERVERPDRGRGGDAPPPGRRDAGQQER